VYALLVEMLVLLYLRQSICDDFFPIAQAAVQELVFNHHKEFITV